LPDGIFSDQKSQSGEFLEGLEMENILWALGIGILRPFTQYILWPFGNLVVIWYIVRVLVFCIGKNLATLLSSREKPISKCLVFSPCVFFTHSVIPNGTESH
jgi:hypothetical protein